MNRKIKKDCETSCEYILPDYMGDIKKILLCKAKAIPGGVYASDGVLESSGTVEYTVLYSDGDNKLTAVSASSDYTAKMPIEQERYADSHEFCEAKNLSIRVTGPRKLQLKCTVETSAVVNEEADFTVEGDTFESENQAETATRVAIFETSKNIQPVEREYAEVAETLEGVIGEDVEIIAAGGNVRITDAEAGEGFISLKGEILLTAIVRTEEQPPYAIRKTIPFEERIDAEDVAPDMSASAVGYVTAASMSVTEDGDNCNIVANIIAEFHPYACHNESAEVMTDAYLKEYETENKYTEISVSALEACEISQVVISGKAPRSQVGAADVSEILMSSGEIKSYQVQETVSGVEILGEILISGIGVNTNAEGELCYTPIKFNSEFSCPVPLDYNIGENHRISCTLSPLECELSLDSENIYFKQPCNMEIHITELSGFKRLSSSKIGEPVEALPTLSHITVYYPADGDTLYGIAKKFHTSVAKLAEDNSISESVMAGGAESGAMTGIKKVIIR